MNLMPLATKLKAAWEVLFKLWDNLWLDTHRQSGRAECRLGAFSFHFYEIRNSGPKISYRNKFKSILLSTLAIMGEHQKKKYSVLLTYNSCYSKIIFYRTRNEIHLHLHGNNIPQDVTLRNTGLYADVHNARALVGYGMCWGLKRTQVDDQMSFGLCFCHSLSS